MTDLIVDAIECQFSSRMVTETDKSTAAVAIELLLQFLQDIKKHATTVAEVLNLLKCAIHSMKSSCHCNAALESACDAFYWLVLPLGSQILRLSFSRRFSIEGKMLDYSSDCF